MISLQRSNGRLWLTTLSLTLLHCVTITVGANLGIDVAGTDHAAGKCVTIPAEHTNRGVNSVEGRSVESCFGSCTSTVCLSKAADFRPGVRMYGLLVGVGCASLCACICGYKEYNGMRTVEEELYIEDNNYTDNSGMMKMNPAHEWVFDSGSNDITIFGKQNPESSFEIEVERGVTQFYQNYNDYMEVEKTLSTQADTCFGGCKQCCAKREDVCNDYDENSSFFMGDDHKVECVDKDLQACGNYYTNCNNGCPL